MMRAMVWVNDAGEEVSMREAVNEASARFEHGGNIYAHPGCVDFSASLNPLGMPAAARTALCEGVDSFCQYPDPNSVELEGVLASFEEVPARWVLACAGATDALFRICEVMRPRRALLCAPCYSGYEQALERVGSEIVRHTLRGQEEYLVTDELVSCVQEGIDLVFIANPNNPTGRCLPRTVLLACLQRAQRLGAIVVVDECFVDLTEGMRSNDLLAAYPNLVLVKAFTKTFALAGLRLGYALCVDEGFLGRLREAGQPWAVSVPAQVAGVACALQRDYLAQAKELVACERVRIVQALECLGLRVIPSDANFLLFKGPFGLAHALLDKGIMVRVCDNFCGLGSDWYRVAVRAPGLNDMLVDALEEVLPCLQSR